MRVLCVNAGSSSLKAALFDVATAAATAGGDDPVCVARHRVEGLDASGDGHRAAFAELADRFDAEVDGAGAIDAVSHRIVHGGRHLTNHAVVDPAVRGALDEARVLAPLHVPVALDLLDAATARYPGRPQVACLDTAFHRRLDPASRRLPLPADLDEEGIRRYGFHGLSYEHLVRTLSRTIPGGLPPRTILAHLGNGASLAAVRDGVGVDTTMGFTPSGGLVMGTRTGDLDPGVLVHLARAHDLDAAGIEAVVDRRSGLLGVSGRSSDVADLLTAAAGGNPDAALALEVYVLAAAKHVAAMTVVLGGLDLLVFSGGVGEHAAPVRAAIAARLAHLGVHLDPVANEAGLAVISSPDAIVEVRVEPTDEEAMLALHAARLLG